MVTKKHPHDQQWSHIRHTQTKDGIGCFHAGNNNYKIILMLTRTGMEGEEGEAERQTSLFIWGIEGGRWCMIKRKQSCHHFWKVGENNPPPPNTHTHSVTPFTFPPQSLCGEQIKEWFESHREEKKEGETLLQVGSTVGSVVQINSLP